MKKEDIIKILNNYNELKEKCELILTLKVKTKLIFNSNFLYDFKKFKFLKFNNQSIGYILEGDSDTGYRDCAYWIGLEDVLMDKEDLIKKYDVLYKELQKQELAKEEEKKKKDLEKKKQKEEEKKQKEYKLFLELKEKYKTADVPS